MNDICKSCGERFTNHLGLEGTCRLLQERTEERDEARKAVRGWIKENGPGGWIDTLRARVTQLEDGLRAVQKHQVATGGEMAKHGSVYLICEKALNPEKS